MAMVFPTSPVVGQVFSSGGRSWVWSGATWDSPRTDNLQNIPSLVGGNTFTGVQTFSTPIAVPSGGTGAATLASGGYLKGAGTSAITSQSGIPAGDITSGTLAQARMPIQPVFQAYSLNNGASGIDLVFPNTYVNTGGHYNTSNGRFTAPSSGTYFFWWANIGGTSGQTHRYYLRKNGSNINDLQLRLPTGSNYAPNGVQAISIVLVANDYVNIFHVSDAGAATFTADQYPSFGGYLIR
jgi:hypothetical protein